MQNTYNIWIPSLQKYHPFKEIKLKHLFFLYKGSINEWDFNFSLYRLLKKLSFDPTLDIDKLTIIDKYVIFIYLRMLCIGTMIDPFNWARYKN